MPHRSNWNMGGKPTRIRLHHHHQTLTSHRAWHPQSQNEIIFRKVRSPFEAKEGNASVKMLVDKGYLGVLDLNDSRRVEAYNLFQKLLVKRP